MRKTLFFIGLDEVSVFMAVVRMAVSWCALVLVFKIPGIRCGNGRCDPQQNREKICPILTIFRFYFIQKSNQRANMTCVPNPGNVHCLRVWCP